MANKVGQGLEYCGQLTIFRTKDWRGYVNSVEDLPPIGVQEGTFTMPGREPTLKTTFATPSLNSQRTWFSFDV